MRGAGLPARRYIGVQERLSRGLGGLEDWGGAVACGRVSLAHADDNLLAAACHPLMRAIV